MLLSDIKTQLSISALELNTAKDINNQPTDWMRHWDNNRRIAVSIHKDLVAELQKDPNTAGLGLQEEEKQGEKGPYRAIRIVKYTSTPAEVIL